VTRSEKGDNQSGNQKLPRRTRKWRLQDFVRVRRREKRRERKKNLYTIKRAWGGGIRGECADGNGLPLREDEINAGMHTSKEDVKKRAHQGGEKY